MKAVSKKDVDYYRNLWVKHLEQVRQERLSYYTRRAQAERDPGNYISLILDFSQAIQLPLIAKPPKAYAMKLQTRYPMLIGGIIDHGQNKNIYYYPSHQFGKGPNMIISMLHNHLHRNYFSQSGLQPRTLFLQADNCAGENKNRYLMGYLSWLVHQGAFDHIYFNFLPVGHTHEDIDQLFSNLHKIRMQGTCHTPAEFYTLLRSAYLDGPHAPMFHSMPVIYDWKEWFTPHLNDIKNHSKPRHFHIFRIQCHVTLTAKATPLTLEESAPVILFQSAPQGLPITCPPLPLENQVNE